MYSKLFSQRRLPEHWHLLPVENLYKLSPLNKKRMDLGVYDKLASAANLFPFSRLFSAAALFFAISLCLVGSVKFFALSGCLNLSTPMQFLFLWFASSFT